ncbi:MAG: TfpX/TfpZ family type IV pilin accessory protein [Hydrogenophaga sp.]|uniref:TfpX/TfpZ family type IV pilin accessory protein n=1 Tax=Hydrogenophaga sp. TaxID=1904254 RepID=UPI002733BC9B|nr:TfpX/TfpZ family type IV pilin accessory protein [Hydrogenophaga sp.]MDP3204980.1 TfpX/TfpZ family type IV pilin accessory protein [Hydrogenophaga sp.]MDP3625705.1 TfpX/TfpZ family type IV pilin accessory protein [Hydrogenophaga sp.]
MSVDLHRRLLWSGGHLLASLLMAAAVAALVFFLWFPHPYRDLSGGIKLFLIIVGVDVVLGPFATMVVASAKKSMRELRMDIALIALLQMGALGYGLWTVAQARPVYMAFEVDRFRVVHAVDVAPTLLALAPQEYRKLPMWGPRLIAVRPFVNNEEKMEVTMAALSGAIIGARPDLWMPYDDSTPAVLAESKPVSDLLNRKPEYRAQIAGLIAGFQSSENSVRYLPVAGRDLFWTVVVNANTAEPLGYLPVDPY